MTRLHKQMLRASLALVTLTSVGLAGTTANAATKLGNSVPKSLWGTWYELNSQSGIMRVKLTAKTYSISKGFFIKGKWTPNWNGGKTYRLGKKVKLRKTFTITAKNNKKGYRTITARHNSYSYVKSQYKRTTSKYSKQVVLGHRAMTYTNKHTPTMSDTYPSELAQYANPAKHFYDEFGIGSLK